MNEPCSLMAMTFWTPAQPSRPAVPRMKPHTMIWSFLLSRWKHMVTTSLSAASLQMGRDCDRQKALLHWLHEGETCARLWPPRRRAVSMPGRRGGEEEEGEKRRSFISSFPPSSRTDRSTKVEGGSSWSSCSSVSLSDGSLRWEDSDPDPDPDPEPLVLVLVVLDLISIMVLFVKHVHLQNVGAAGQKFSISFPKGFVFLYFQDGRICEEGRLTSCGRQGGESAEEEEEDAKPVHLVTW